MNNQLLSGKWSSSFREVHLSFNRNVWAEIPGSYDEGDGSLYGVIDPKDGTSFVFDWAAVEEGEVLEYDGNESAYLIRLSEIDSNVAEVDRYELEVGGVVFRCVAYSFLNRKYGSQIVIRGMWIGSQAAFGISMAWSSSLSFVGSKIPPKLQILLQAFVIREATMSLQESVVYDKAKYHYETIEALGLPRAHAYHHATFFLLWLIKKHLLSEELEHDEGKMVSEVRYGKRSVNELYEWLGCCLISEMLSPEGNAFAQAYFDFESGMYLSDYIRHLQKSLPSEFHVSYTIGNEEIIHWIIDKRFNDWKKGKL